MFIFPYKAESSSAKALAKALGAKRILLENSKFKGHPSKIVINWGNSMTNEEIEKATVLNTPEAVARASNKLKFFELVNGQVPIPEFTRDVNEARTWLEGQGIVVVRENLNGHSGQGIVLLEDVQSFDAYNHSRSKLYTRYIPKKHEFRLHVVGGVVADVQQKRKRADFPNEMTNYKIRNHQTGFIYAREDVTLPSTKMEEDAINAVRICGLHFGAVDMIWNEYRKTGFILEINTAPGLEGQTVDNYAAALAILMDQPVIDPVRIDWNTAVLLQAPRPDRPPTHADAPPTADQPPHHPPHSAGADRPRRRPDAPNEHRIQLQMNDEWGVEAPNMGFQQV